MPIDPDDLTPEQRGRSPSGRELRARTRLFHSRFGRLGRPRSWATVLVAILVVGFAYLLIRLTGRG